MFVEEVKDVGFVLIAFEVDAMDVKVVGMADADEVVGSPTLLGPALLPLSALTALRY